MNQFKRYPILLLTLFFSLAVQAFQKPNILFIFTDDQTYDSIRALGNQEVITPNMDRLATDGTAFLNVYNPGGWHGAVCVASRCMMNTQRFLWAAHQLDNPKKLKEEREQGKLWALSMKKAGYKTYITGKWHVQIPADTLFDVTRHIRPGMPPSCPAAYERPVEGKTDIWQPWDKRRGGYWKGGKHWSEVVADDVVDYLNQADPDKPFFIYAAFNAPHDPRQSPKRFVDMYPPEKISIPPNYLMAHPYKDQIGCPHDLRDERLAPDPRTPFAVRKHRSEYYALITHLDGQIGRILEALKAKGLEKKTLIAFAADHGLSVGQHGLIGKQSVYEHSMKPPLIFCGPGVPSGKRVSYPVYLQDLVPTLCDLAGIESPDYSQFTSRAGLVRDGDQPHDRACIYGVYMNVQRMIRVGDMKLIWFVKPNVFQLFNVAKDRYEIHDLSKDPAHRDTVKTLKRALAREIKARHDPLRSSKKVEALTR